MIRPDRTFASASRAVSSGRRFSPREAIPACCSYGDRAERSTGYPTVPPRRKLPLRGILFGMNRREFVTAHQYRYAVLFEPAEEGGYVVTYPSLPGLVTEGDTLEARAMAADAIRGYLEALAKDGLPIPPEDPQPRAPVPCRRRTCRSMAIRHGKMPRPNCRIRNRSVAADDRSGT